MKNGPNLLQQLLSNPLGFMGFGRRQKRRLKKRAADMPSEPLVTEYKNGMRIRFVPICVCGELLLCDAFYSTPDQRNEMRTQVRVSRYEFKTNDGKELFDRYFAAMAASAALTWADGTPLNSDDLK